MPKCTVFVRVALQFYNFSRQNTDRGNNHSIQHVASSKAIIIFSIQIGTKYGIMKCHTLVYEHTSNLTTVLYSCTNCTSTRTRT